MGWHGSGLGQPWDEEKEALVRRVQAEKEKLPTRQRCKQIAPDLKAILDAITAERVAARKPPVVEKPLAPRPPGPAIFCYTRCSHADSAESGLGLEAQEARLRAYVELLKVKPGLGGHQFGGLFTDTVSAYKKPFSTRKQGSRLVRILRSGDHLCFARLDRAFRNLKDLTSQVEHWQRLGVTVHFVDEGWDLGTANGRLIMYIMGAIAQWQSEYISARNKEAIAARRSRGHKKIRLPWGWRWDSPRGTPGRKLLLDASQRQLAKAIIAMRDERGMSWVSISFATDRYVAMYGDPAFYKCRYGYSPARLWRIYHDEKALAASIASAKETGEALKPIYLTHKPKQSELAT